MKIGYIVHNLNDPSVERRCQMLERGGAQIRLAGFCRDDALTPTIAAREPLMMGQSADAAMIKRALATVRATFANADLADFMDDCEVIMARNLEQLAIATRLRSGRRLVYECLDIHRSLTGDGLAARAIQFIEGRLLPGVDLLVTSSPAFVRQHFDQTPLNAPVKLVENKLLTAPEEVIRPHQPEAKPPIVIGWFGMLRCKRTLAFLSDLTTRSGGCIRALICGVPSPAELPDFEREVAAHEGLTFTGRYAYSDLPALYGQCHFAWAIDWFEEGLNSSWLLPNRIYEASAHGAVPIGLADVEVGRWLERRGVGLRVTDAADAMEQLLAMDAARVRQLQDEVTKIARRDVLADTTDCIDLVEAIAGAPTS